MGLPQELIDHITDMLHGNLPALKACSLTCKAMFASTRHLIHQTLYLVPQNMQDAFADKHGFLQYTRRVSILHHTFTLSALQLHLQKFQSLDRVHTLILEGHDVSAWTSRYRLCFAHFHPTLTSLTLRRPFGSFQLIFQFALQFPILENLCLEEVQLGTRFEPDPIDLVEMSPPLKHLRVAGCTPSERWPVSLTHEIQSSMTFRSVEVVDLAGSLACYMLDACAHTLEALTVVLRGTGMERFSFPSLLQQDDNLTFL